MSTRRYRTAPGPRRLATAAIVLGATAMALSAGASAAVHTPVERGTVGGVAAEQAPTGYPTTVAHPLQSDAVARSAPSTNSLRIDVRATRGTMYATSLATPTLPAALSPHDLAVVSRAYHPERRE